MRIILIFLVQESISTSKEPFHTMSEQQQVQQQLWKIANELRGKMDANEFKDYMLGFIFYKYLSEKMLSYANDLLKDDGVSYTKELDQEILNAIQEESMAELGFYLKPEDLFSTNQRN